MLKPTVKRGQMLNFIPDEIICPEKVDQNRVHQLNNLPIKKGSIVYLMSREMRVEDNWGLIFANELALKHKRKLLVCVDYNNVPYSRHQIGLLLDGLNFLKKNLALNCIDYEICDSLPTNLGAFVVDFNPLCDIAPRLSPPPLVGRKNIKNNLNCATFEVDSHNIIPARYISDKQEYSAATLRRKIYSNIAGFLTEYPKPYSSVTGKAQTILNEFIQEKINFYAELKNDPNKDFTSNLSPYLHFGFISSQRIALEVIRSSASRENKEAFLEELIVRKELADNFCLYNKNFMSLASISNWAKASLDAHRNDLRNYIYSQNDFEYAKTHDALWNSIQKCLLNTGKIHGYLRMFWAKKILEWSVSPEEALRIAIYLNDKYSLDGVDPNGYVGILWSIGGIHDRAFANRMVTGKIRYMGAGSMKKISVKEYIASQKD